MPNMPQEFTPEMNQDFYDSLSRPIQERTDANVGKVRGEALARGLEGDPFESTGVSAVRNSGSNALADLWSNINMQGADKARQERMVGEGQDWQAGQSQLGRDFQSAESEKQRSFQAQMSELDRANQRRMDRGNKSNGWGDIAGLAAGYFTGGIGAGLAKKMVG